MTKLSLNTPLASRSSPRDPLPYKSREHLSITLSVTTSSLQSQWSGLLSQPRWLKGCQILSRTRGFSPFYIYKFLCTTEEKLKDQVVPFWLTFVPHLGVFLLEGGSSRMRSLETTLSSLVSVWTPDKQRIREDRSYVLSLLSSTSLPIFYRCPRTPHVITECDTQAVGLRIGYGRKAIGGRPVPPKHCVETAYSILLQIHDPRDPLKNKRTIFSFFTRLYWVKRETRRGKRDGPCTCLHYKVLHRRWNVGVPSFILLFTEVRFLPPLPHHFCLLGPRDYVIPR